MIWLALIPGIAVLVLLTGAAYQTVETDREARLYPPPGRMLDVGGHRLHILIAGEQRTPGQPTVVFDSGLGATSTSWRLVAPEIAKFARVVTYDRAGLGWSEESTAPRTAQRNVGELRALLKGMDVAGASVAPPYLLVGHSYGAYDCRLFAAQFPDEVAGLVLVDGIHPREWLEPSPAEERGRRFGVRLCRRGARLARLGVARAYLEGVVAGQLGLSRPAFQFLSSGATVVGKRVVNALRKLPRELQPVILSHWSRPSFFASTGDHMEYLPESAAQVADAEAEARTRLAGNYPIVCLSPDSARPERVAASKVFAEASPRGCHVLVENSSHFIQLDQPHAVVIAVMQRLAATPPTPDHEGKFV